MTRKATRRSIRRRSPGPIILLTLALAALLTTPTPSRGQVVPAIVGGVGGLLAGAHVSTGFFVLKTRATGWMMHSVEHLLEPGWETAPLVVGPVAGAVIGYRSSSSLASAGLWGGVGLVSGAALGAAAGHMVWGDAEGRWAGGVMGSAAGLLLGIVLGAAKGRSDGDSDDSTPTDVGVSLRLPFGGSS